MCVRSRGPCVRSRVPVLWCGGIRRGAPGSGRPVAQEAGEFFLVGGEGFHGRQGPLAQRPGPLMALPGSGSTAACSRMPSATALSICACCRWCWACAAGPPPDGGSHAARLGPATHVTARRSPARCSKLSAASPSARRCSSSSRSRSSISRSRSFSAASRRSASRPLVSQALPPVSQGLALVSSTVALAGQALAFLSFASARHGSAAARSARPDARQRAVQPPCRAGLPDGVRLRDLRLLPRRCRVLVHPHPAARPRPRLRASRPVTSGRGSGIAAEAVAQGTVVSWKPELC